MSIDTNIFKPIPKVDLNRIDDTLSTLETGHLKAIEAASALKQAYAAMPLNEAENEWKAQQIARIQQTIDDNSRGGNVYGALDDLIRLEGDIKSNPGLLGRLQAQKDYQTFMEYLDKANINEDTKQRMRDLNPYRYQDQYDDNGNVIGGSKWTLNIRPVKEFDKNAAFTQALKQVAPDITISSTDRYAYVDENGNKLIKDDINPSYGKLVGVYDTITNTTTKIPEDKLRAAYEGIMEADSENIAGFKQDYENALYFNKPEVLKEDGVTTKTLEEYKRDTVDKLIQTSAKEQIQRQIVKNTETQRALTKITSNGNNDNTESVDGRNYNIAEVMANNPGTEGFNFAIKATNPAQLKAKLDSDKSKLFNEWNSIDGVKSQDALNNVVTEAINTGNIKDGIDYINSLIKDSKNSELTDKYTSFKYELIDYAKDYAEYKSRFDNLPEDVKTNILIKTAIDGKIPITTEMIGDSDYAKNLVNQIGNLYNRAFSNSDNIYYKTYTKEQLESIKRELDFNNIPYVVNEDKIILNKENKEYSINFYDIVNKYDKDRVGKGWSISDSSGRISELDKWARIKNPALRKWGPNTMSIIGNSITGYNQYESDVTSGQIINKIKKLYDSISTNIGDTNDSYVAPGKMIDTSSMIEQVDRNALLAGVTDPKEREALKESIKQVDYRTNAMINGRYDAMINGGVQVLASDINASSSNPWINLGDPNYDNELAKLREAIKNPDKEVSTQSHTLPNGKRVKGVHFSCKNKEYVDIDGTKKQVEKFESYTLLLNDYDKQDLDILETMNGSYSTESIAKAQDLIHSNYGGFYRVFSTVKNGQDDSINVKYDRNSGALYLSNDSGKPISRPIYLENSTDASLWQMFYSSSRQLENLIRLNKRNVFDNTPTKFAKDLKTANDNFINSLVALGITEQKAKEYIEQLNNL